MNRRSGGYRLSTGGVIDRTRTLVFSFNGQRFSGHPGDTLASALIASGVHVIARSLKYHRPRGFYGMGIEDPSSMVAVTDSHGHDPAIRAGQVLLAQGLRAHSVSGTPSPNFDFGAVAQLGSGILAAGFYYKTFIGRSWKWAEPLIRKATGIGRPSSGIDLRAVRQRHAICDVLIVGAGPAGLWTAYALRGSGLNVTVADDQPTFGGSLKWRVTDASLPDIRTATAELAADPHFRLLPSTFVTGAYDGNFFTLVQTVNDDGGVIGEIHWKLRALQVVLASGMLEQPLLFDGNDRPGIMLSSAAHRLIGVYAVSPARRLAIYANNDEAYAMAISAKRAGISIVAIIDTRPERDVAPASRVRALDVPCYFESQIETTQGYRRIRGVVVRSNDARVHRIRCDGLAISGGWMPSTHLAAHRGCKPEFDEAHRMYQCRVLPAGWFAAGGASGTHDLQLIEAESKWIAHMIVERALPSNGTHGVRPTTDRVAGEAGLPGDARANGTPFELPRYGSPSRTWIDLQNDVKLSDIALAVTENYRSVEHLKRYTTLGMGTDQGRTSNVNGLAVLATLTGHKISEIGTTTFRPPYVAVRMATIASGRHGDRYRPRRYLPADEAHRALGAVMGDFGWERPDWYQCNGNEREAAVAAEMRAVREHVGVFDGSSLGKIEITGPDAAQFLAKFYVSNMATLAPGKIRYSLMLRDDGVIFDDGVVTRIGENHFLASPTTGNAEAVAAWFERWHQTEWPWLQVAIAPVTSQWTAIAVAGPQARALLQRLEPDFDLAPAAFLHMEFREGTVSGFRARVSRISFTGELQYEIAVPARRGTALMQSLLAAEAGLSPRAVGLEAWRRLRLEKGYLHLGSDTNGRTTALDVGMESIARKRRDDFIGKRSLALPFATSSEREQLVGLVALDGTLAAGGRILATGCATPPCRTDGYVTSACYSPSAERSIGLALLERGYQRYGEELSVYDAGRLTRCRVTGTTFYDPGNDRLRL